MKQLRKSIRVIALVLALMVLLPIGYGGYSLIRYGTRWRTSEYNTYLTSMKSGVTAGSIYDRNGVTLASTTVSTDETGETMRTRTYAQDASVRAAVVHVGGDTRGNVKNAAESFMAEYLYGTNMSYAERLKQVLSTGSLRGDDITLTLDSSLCAYAASLFPQDKSGAIVVMNYKTGEIYALQSFPNYDPQSGKTVTVLQGDHLGRRIAKPARRGGEQLYLHGRRELWRASARSDRLRRCRARHADAQGRFYEKLQFHLRHAGLPDGR